MKQLLSPGISLKYNYILRGSPFRLNSNLNFAVTRTAFQLAFYSETCYECAKGVNCGAKALMRRYI